MSKLYSGAEIVFKCLEDQNVEFIFGYPGGAVLPIYDELKNFNSVKHILVRHEQGAGHAAEGYARSSGKPGVLLVTSGPGATNAVTALTDAYMDSVPLVCISGQVPTHLIGTDAFQECDTTGITRPCTKHNWLVKDVKDLEKTIHKAFEVATTGRPGPVLVDIPKAIQFHKNGPGKYLRTEISGDGAIDIYIDKNGLIQNIGRKKRWFDYPFVCLLRMPLRLCSITSIIGVIVSLLFIQMNQTLIYKSIWGFFIGGVVGLLLTSQYAKEFPMTPYWVKRLLGGK